MDLSDDVENLTTKAHRIKQLDEKTMIVPICEMFLLSEIESPSEKFQIKRQINSLMLYYVV